jgi:DNA-binding transcriptional LysR family regulator
MQIPAYRRRLLRSEPEKLRCDSLWQLLGCAKDRHHRLAVTQPTASGMLKRLRETFGDELFLRTSHGLLPTPRAEALSGPVKTLLHEAESLFNADVFDPSAEETAFKISASDYMQHTVVIPAIKEIRLQAPSCRVAAMPRSRTRLAEQLTRGEVDVCVCARETAPLEMSASLLYRDRYICVARSAHPLKSGSLTDTQLTSWDHVLVDPTGTSFIGPIDIALAKKNRGRRVAMTVPNFSNLFELLESGNFLAFVPERLLAILEQKVKMFDVNVALPDIEVVAIWHPRFSGDARHKWLRNVLVEVTTL